MIDAAQKYYDKLNGGKVIAIDFDNTVCLDEWPEVGPLFEDAIKVLKELINNGHYLIPYTQRSKKYPLCCPELKQFIKDHPERDHVNDTGFILKHEADILTDAINIFKDNGIEIFDINKNSKWEQTTGDDSRKLFADYFIDDHNVGMQYKIIINKNGKSCKVCDWNFIDDWFVKEGLYKEKVLQKDNTISSVGKTYNCECIKENIMLTRDGEYVRVVHKPGDKTQCKEILNKNNEVIGYYIKYDVFRYRCFDFNEYYKIID